jgi:hypothetical protein
MKIEPKIFRGIVYIQLSQLPVEQRTKFANASKKVLIKILIDGKIVSDCVQFKDYESWYDAEYKPSRTNSGDIQVPVNILSN